MLLAIAWTPSLVAPPHQLSRASLLRTAASAALTLPLGAKAVEAPPPFELGTRDAFAAFAAGDYTRAEQLWSRATEAYPDSALAHANLATLLRSIRAAALYMTIARHASCDGGALGVVRVFANGTPDCSRSSNTSACESAARRIIGKLR